MGNDFISAHEDTAVDGKYRLGAVVRRSIVSTVYETEFDDAGQIRPAVIKVRPLDEDHAESMVARWRQAMELTHPNLLRLYAAGTSVIDGAASEYAVMERADESLSAVLAERPLSEDELRRMFDPAVEALRGLHEKGYAHGSLKASNVFACGDHLKLSSDSAIRVKDGGVTGDDIRALGALILDALKLSAPPSGGPFAQIARYCLTAPPLCTAADLQTWVKDREAPVAPAPAPQIVAPVTKDAAVAEKHATPKWVFAVLGAIVLLVALRAVMRKSAPESTPVAPAPVVQPAAPPAAPIPRPEPPRAAAKPASGWSVIVATYGSREAAEKRARALSAKSPKFNASVSEQRTEKAPYVVVLGQNLSESEAESLRQQAVKAGLPRDTYIKRLR